MPKNPRPHVWRVVATVTKTHDPGNTHDDETYTVVEPGEYETRQEAEDAAEERRWTAPPPDRTVDFSVALDPEDSGH